MVNHRNFDKSIFDSYIQKIRSSSDLHKIENLRSAVTSWLDWLKERKIISSSQYAELMKQVESSSIERKKFKTHLATVEKKKISYVLITLIILVLCLLTFNIYTYKTISQLRTSLAQESSEGRVLPFKGTIKQTDGAPLDTKRDAVFSLYTTEEGGTPVYSGSCLGENGLEPTFNGSFSILVGSDCGMKPIPEEFFTSNAALYLGVKIGNEPEFSPRYQIITSTFSQDTNKLQGLSTGTSVSSIPFINEEGSIEITNESPTVKSTNGIFTIEGKTITVRSTEEGGNIIFDPAAGSNMILGSGRLGIGTFSPETQVDISGTSLLGNVATISNLTKEDSATASILKLSVGTSPDGSNAEFIEFFAGVDDVNPGVKVGGIRLNNQSVVYETSAADFAEYFEVDNPEEFKLGQIVSISERGINPSLENEHIVGVVSDTAGYIGNNKYTYSKRVLVGLVGQVDVLVTDLKGDISKGDRIGSSVISGYGEKNTDGIFQVGYSLENSEDRVMSNANCPESVLHIRTINGERIRCGYIKIIISMD